MSTLLPVGSTAPDFTLPNSTDTTVTLSDLQGKPVVLVFYPADFSAGCGDELNIFNQARPLFEKYNATILGISVDGPWCHAQFKQERRFYFDLLADFEPKGAVGKLYGAYNTDTGVENRDLFVVDSDGKIAWNYSSPVTQNPGVAGVLQALEGLK